MSQPRGIVHSHGRRRYRYGLTVVGIVATRTTKGPLGLVCDLVDELVDVARDEWPDVAHLDRDEIEWWLRDIVGDAAPPVTRRTEPRPFAFAPIEVAARNGRPAHPANERCPYCFHHDDDNRWCVRIADVAELLGVDVRQVYRLRQRGLTVDEADSMAVRLGTHPAFIWPDWATIDGQLEATVA